MIPSTLRQARLPLLDADDTRTVWTLHTVLWSFIAITLPAYRAFPDPIKLISFAGLYLLLAISVVAKRVRQPLYAGVWIFAGYSSCVAILTATNQATIKENLVVGGQLAVLLGFAVFVMTANAALDPRFIPRVSAAFLIGQTASSLAGIAQVLGQPVFGREASFGRAPGLSGHPNALGIMACVAILLCLYIATSFIRFRVAALIMLAANIGGILSTGSLSALMSLSVGVLVLLVCMRESLMKLALGAATFIPLLWLIASSTGYLKFFRSPQDRYLQVTGQVDAESTWEIRQRTYSFAWDEIKKEPIFGNGLGGEYGGTYDGITLTHNIFLRAWYQGGIFLAISIACILMALLLIGIRAVTKKTNAAEVSVLVAVMTFALTSAFFEQPDYWMPVLVAWASISAAEDKLCRVGARTS